MLTLDTSERNERNSYYQLYMGRLDNIQTVQKPSKILKKCKYILITILGLAAELFKAMNHFNPARSDRNAL